MSGCRSSAVVSQVVPLRGAPAMTKSGSRRSSRGPTWATASSTAAAHSSTSASVICVKSGRTREVSLARSETGSVHRLSGVRRLAVRRHHPGTGGDPEVEQVLHHRVARGQVPALEPDA